MKSEAPKKAGLFWVRIRETSAGYDGIARRERIGIVLCTHYVWSLNEDSLEDGFYCPIEKWGPEIKQPKLRKKGK